ncbi:NADPH oxidase [Mytilus galloprovincialis]|nr:NADPH oxidase [Mytilus galloprovincialis]
MLILLPVCRNLVLFLRGSFQNIRRQLDKHITFHRYIAYMICHMTVIHVGAHVFNVERYAEAYDSPTPDRELLRVLSGLGSGNSSIFLNPIREPTDPILATLRFLAGVSGIVITLSLIIMVSAATELIRRSYFEVFWFTHHLFVLFFIGLVVHGFEGIVRRQTPASVMQHNPLNCSANPSNWGKRDSSGQMRCPIPEFEGISAKAWMWTIGPMVIYIIERIVRFVRSQQRVVITKAPEDDYFSIHVRRAGDWTDALAKACHIDDDDYTATSKLPM